MRERRLALEGRIRAHPAHLEHQELEAFRQTLIEVFVANGRELTQLLTAAAENEELAIELVQNVRDRAVAEAFFGAASRALHNYVASSSTVVDHARRLMRKRTGPIADEYQERKLRALENPELPFVQDLRNFTLHRRLPFLGHSFRLTRSADGTAMKSEVRLSVVQLLEWGGWTVAGRRMLDSTDAADGLSLRPLVERHGAVMCDLNGWLNNALFDALDLTEVNDLVRQRNALLVSGDVGAPGGDDV